MKKLKYLKTERMKIKIKCIIYLFVMEIKRKRTILDVVSNNTVSNEEYYNPFNITEVMLIPLKNILENLNLR